jgi:hypothetical protein
MIHPYQLPWRKRFYAKFNRNSQQFPCHGRTQDGNANLLSERFDLPVVAQVGYFVGGSAKGADFDLIQRQPRGKLSRRTRISLEDLTGTHADDQGAGVRDLVIIAG